jgi:hypothetical protein
MSWAEKDARAEARRHGTQCLAYLRQALSFQANADRWRAAVVEAGYPDRVRESERVWTSQADGAALGAIEAAVKAAHAAHESMIAAERRQLQAAQ